MIAQHLKTSFDVRQLGGQCEACEIQDVVDHHAGLMREAVVER